MPVGFTEEGAARIIKAVKRVERMPQNARPRQRRVIVPVPNPGEFSGVVNLAGSVAACDHRTPGIFHSSFSGMPSISATIKKANSDGKFATLETATIYNPLPFSFGGGDIVSVRKTNKVWLIERCLNKTPFADFRTTAGALTSDNKVTWSLQAVAGGIASAQDSGKSLRIDCPVTSARFKIWASVHATFSGASSSSQAEIRGGLLIDGVQGQPNPWYHFTPVYPSSTDAGGSPSHSHNITNSPSGPTPSTTFGLSFETVVSLSKDNTVGFYVVAPFGASYFGAVQSGTFVIEPAF